ncbi:MAG TPA: hypothetical protein VFG52_09230 [Xanthomonadales bacterium]|nr:hypothetical protein [Xanthomonadales bacterium]
MILQNLSHGFRNKDWFTVAIELFIVVLGVFLGLQVNDWNESRIEDRQSAEYTERLLADLRLEAWNYDTMIAYLRDVQSNADRALEVLEGSSVASNEQLLIYAYRATQYSDSVRRRATFDELTSTGKIGLIRDPFLRDVAASVYTRGFISRTTEEGSMAPYRIAFRKLLPVAIQEAVTQNCGDPFIAVGDYSAIQNQLDYPCKTGLSPEQIDHAGNLLRTDPEIIAQLRLQAVNLRTHIALFTFSNQDLMEGLHAIAGETP